MKRSRTHTISINRESAARRSLKVLVPPYDRPQTRADCEDTPRPCPFIGCRHNLSADTVEVWDDQRKRWEHNIRINHAGADDPTDIEPPAESNCAIDYAERGGMTLEEVGEALGVTRERVRQIEAAALEQIRDASGVLDSEQAAQLLYLACIEDASEDPVTERAAFGLAYESGIGPEMGIATGRRAGRGR